MNGSVPAPTLRWREGDTVTLRVANTLDEEASIHWHGIVLPANMDGVPGLSFHGIRPAKPTSTGSACDRPAPTGTTATPGFRNSADSTAR